MSNCAQTIIALKMDLFSFSRGNSQNYFTSLIELLLQYWCPGLCYGPLHPDLDKIVVLSVEQQEENENEDWQMDAGEKLVSIPQLKTEGNQLF